MALVTISGFPCSGKTTRAKEIAVYFNRRAEEVAEASSSSGTPTPKYDVVVVDDAGCHVVRAAYDDSRAEKPARAALFTAATRSLNSSTITILDSANYIKGFRYQLYCAAREAGVRVATVRVAAPPGKCREWHETRDEADKYKEETFENMIMRYEEPSSMARWDSPLFTLPWDEAAPLEDLWLAATKGGIKPPTGAVATAAKPPAGTLQTLTNTTSTIVAALLAHLAAAPGSAEFRIPSPPAPAPTPASRGKNRHADADSDALILHLPHGRMPTLAELQRHKRAFEAQQRLAFQTNSRGAGSWTQELVARGFVTYLETAWGADA